VPIIGIHPERIISIGIGDLNRDAHQLTINARDAG
jgi:hypothetical protein